MEDVKYIPVCGHFLTHFKIPKLDLYSPSPLSSPPSHQKAFENKNIHYERKGLEDDEVGSFFYNFPSNFLPMFNPICNHSHHACDDLFVQSVTIFTLLCSLKFEPYLQPFSTCDTPLTLCAIILNW